MQHTSKTLILYLQNGESKQLELIIDQINNVKKIWSNSAASLLYIHPLAQAYANTFITFKHIKSCERKILNSIQKPKKLFYNLC